MSDIKTCPFCAEEIKAEAILCKHCRSDLRSKAGSRSGLTEAPPELLSIAEGLDIDGLQRELARRDEELMLLRSELTSVKSRLAAAEAQQRQPQVSSQVVSQVHLNVSNETNYIARLIQHLGKDTGLPPPLIVAGILGALMLLLILLLTNK